MNRYPLWKYILVAVALVFGFIYTLPNFYGESPAVQVSSAKVTLKIDEGTRARVESALQAASITHDGIQLDTVGVKARFKDTDTQLKAKDVLERAFNPDPTDPQYVIALNLLSASPYFYGITRRNLEGFTVQIYRPDGTPGADIVEFVELGTFECGDGTECGQSGGGADVTLLVSLPL